MNIVDALLILVIAVAVYSNWKKGFLLGLMELISWISTIIIGLWLYPSVANLLESHLQVTGAWSIPVSFILTILLMRMIISAILTPPYNAIPEQAHTSKLNTFLGVIPGLAAGVIYAALIATLFMVIPFSPDLTRASQSSFLANKLSGKVELLESRLTPNLSEVIKRPTGKLGGESTSNKFIKLPFAVKNAKPREDLELEMLVLINNERKKQGLGPLKFDRQLVPVARAHSRDMFIRSYFSHVSPEGNSPFDRIREAEVPFITAGENLALAQTLNIAHNGLMNSPGHRANILRPTFGRVGIGILDGGIYGLMVTQNFRN
ncbi:MAG TPA: CvpA family protein [Sphingobacteriaceae bacterium]